MEAPQRSPSGGIDTAAEERPVSVLEEFERHEALLRRGTLTVRVAIARDRALSFGVTILPDAPYVLRARAERIPTVHRSSGGSGILHFEGDLLWAVVLPRADERVGRDFARAYGRLGAGVARGLSALGIRAAWVPAPGLSDDYCSLSRRGEVLEVEGKVLGGAAQHLTSRALLHHGIVAWAVDRPCVDRLFGFPPGGPSSRLGGLAELGESGGPEAVAGAVARGLSEQYGR